MSIDLRILLHNSVGFLLCILNDFWVVNNSNLLDTIVTITQLHIVIYNTNVNVQGIQTKRPVEVQNAMLRRHLLELTQSFMIPLVSFFCIYT